MPARAPCGVAEYKTQHLLPPTTPLPGVELPPERSRRGALNRVSEPSGGLTPLRSTRRGPDPAGPRPRRPPPAALAISGRRGEVVTGAARVDAVRRLRVRALGVGCGAVGQHRKVAGAVLKRHGDSANPPPDWSLHVHNWSAH